MGGSLNLEILRGGGLKQFWKSRWKGGSKNRAFRRWGVDFFWNNPFRVEGFELNLHIDAEFALHDTGRCDSKKILHDPFSVFFVCLFVCLFFLLYLQEKSEIG